MDVVKYLKDKSLLIEKQLDLIVPDISSPYQSLFKAARYSLLSGGKRLRPILALATVETLQGSVEKALIPSCALELIHTYSLIHDDLPCMDNDDFRRGKPSLHKAFPEGHAVLAGDFLLTYAFDVLANAPHLSSDQKLKLVSILSRQAGGHGMIGGQIMDLEAEGQLIDKQALELLHKKKTGALISASIEFGTVIADVSSDKRKYLANFGEKIGLAFQIIDDVLDVTSANHKGKQKASDQANNKATFVSLMGIENAKLAAQNLFVSSLEDLKNVASNISILKSLAEHMIIRSF